MDELTINQSKPEPIGSLTGLKVVAVFAIYFWHGFCPKPPLDMGARVCEILFLTSGFLVGYNYYLIDMPANLKQSFKYVLKKLKIYWPLHLITLLWSGVLNCDYHINVETIQKAVINCFLLQSWSCNPEFFFSFNGASWFFSSLLFCYFLSPFLLKFTKRIKWHIPAFFIVFLIRHLFEYLINKGYITHISVHVFPPIRCLEFFLGMLLVPLFMKTRKKLETRDNILLFSLLEVLMVIYTLVAYVICDEYWQRSQFVLLSSLLVFVISLNNGIISKILSIKAFKLFSTIQFEFFLLHQTVIVSIGFTLLNSDWLRNMVTIIITITLSVLYHLVITNLQHHKRYDGIINLKNQNT